MKECFEKVLLLISPICPYIAEELWEEIGHKPFISLEAFPKYDPELIKEDTFILVIQVNGKVRDQVEVSVELSKDEIVKIAKERPKIMKYLEGKTLKNVVFVPKKLINFVVS